jgi:hypothetical protein
VQAPAFVERSEDAAAKRKRSRPDPRSALN